MKGLPFARPGPFAVARLPPAVLIRRLKSRARAATGPRTPNAELVGEKLLARSSPEAVRLLSGTYTARVLDGTGALCGAATLRPLQGSKALELWCVPRRRRAVGRESRLLVSRAARVPRAASSRARRFRPRELAEGHDKPGPLAREEGAREAREWRERAQWLGARSSAASGSCSRRPAACRSRFGAQEPRARPSVARRHDERVRVEHETSFAARPVGLSSPRVANHRRVKRCGITCHSPSSACLPP